MVGELIPARKTLSLRQASHRPEWPQSPGDQLHRYMWHTLVKKAQVCVRKPVLSGVLQPPQRIRRLYQEYK
jgi:hypothetical protein